MMSSAQTLKSIAGPRAVMDTTALTKTAIRGREGEKEWDPGRKREQNWTKVSSLMPPPAAVKPSHGSSAK